MLVDKRINGPKGKIMNLQQPVDINVIERQARTAIATGDQDDLDVMYDSVRTVSPHPHPNPLLSKKTLTKFKLVQAFAVFDYVNSGDAALRFNSVRQNVRIQFGNIERATGQQNLVAWWDAWSADFFAMVGSK